MGKNTKKTGRASKASKICKENGGGAEGGTTWVLVETVELTRRRYAIETPGDKTAWALDTVVMGEAEELSSVPLGETIVSFRAVSEDEVIAVAGEDGVGANEARARSLGLEE
jgi:hypothetical protein